MQAVSLSIPFLSTVIKTRVAGASDLQTRGWVIPELFELFFWLFTFCFVPAQCFSSGLHHVMLRLQVTFGQKRTPASQTPFQAQKECLQWDMVCLVLGHGLCSLAGVAARGMEGAGSAAVSLSSTAGCQPLGLASHLCWRPKKTLCICRLCRSHLLPLYWTTCRLLLALERSCTISDASCSQCNCPNTNCSHDCVPGFAALLGVSLVTMGKFYAASPAAGFLMLPYLGWTCFATTLINCSLWDSNPAVVQSAHKVAQVRPQEPHEVSQSRSLHKRNITCPADLGKINPTTAAQSPGSIQYSDRPILGRRTSGEHLPTQDWHRALAQNNQQPQLHSAQPQLQQPWDTRADNQPAMYTPFAEAGLHRRSATDSSRRTTRRTTDDHLSSDRSVTHTDSGHLIIPQWSWDRPERKNSPGLGGSGIFARVCLCPLVLALPAWSAACHRVLLCDGSTCLKCSMQHCSNTYTQAACNIVHEHAECWGLPAICICLCMLCLGMWLHYSAGHARAVGARARLLVICCKCGT